MSTPPPTPEGGGSAAPMPLDPAVLRARRRMYLRRRMVAGLVALAVLAGTTWGGVVLVQALTRPGAPVANAARSPDAPTSPPAYHVAGAAGALGNVATLRACRLLSPAQIARAFDRHTVSRPYPTYPFCQWFLGHDSFLALGIRPATAIAAVRDTTSVVQEAPGIGADAFFGNDRNLYFGDAHTTYWLQYEQVGAFTGIHVPELERLARAVLAGAPAPPAKQAPPALQPTASPPAQMDLRQGTAADPLRIWFAGDSLSAGPSWAFFELTKDDPGFVVTPEYQVGTGLVRDDYFDWTRHAAGAVAALEPNVAIYMGGANDDQELLVDGRYRAVGEPAWTQEFRRRVGAMMDVMTQGGRAVIWVGMPPMQNPTLDHGMRAVNEAYVTEARERPLVTYVDAYDIFGGRGGAGYTDSIVFHGHRQEVRLADGIHLNGVGSTVVADVILKDLHTLVRS